MAKQTELERKLADLEKLKAKGVLNDEEYATRRAAIVASTEASVAVREGGSKAGGIFKWGFFGCFGIIAAIVIFVVVIAALVAAGSSSDDNKNATPGQAGTNKGDVHVAFGANASAEIAPEGNSNKKIRVTILQSADNIQSKNQFSKPAAGKKWWGMEVVIEDVGTAEASTPDWKLRDAKDIEHDRAFVVGGPGADLELARLTPGGKVQGWVYFEIDSDTQPKWIRADPNFLLKNDLYFDVK